MNFLFDLCIIYDQMCIIRYILLALTVILKVHLLRSYHTHTKSSVYVFYHRFMFSTTLISLWWLLQFSSKSSNKFALIYAHFAYITAICDHIKRIRILVCPIFYGLFVFSYCCFRVESIVEDSTLSSIFCSFSLKSLTLSSFLIE